MGIGMGQSGVTQDKREVRVATGDVYVVVEERLTPDGTDFQQAIFDGNGVRRTFARSTMSVGVDLALALGKLDKIEADKKAA